ncbi:MAG: DUF2834 domain-containing protein [Cyclobacteriaceae bacterium]|nr:DUF2834 domain-containing protein [Cyclobacteriaceae bacterium]
MKRIYFYLSVIGFITPNIFVAVESIHSGNILFYLDPVATITSMFPNMIATAFIVDLLFVVLVFIIWSHHEAQKYRIKNVWVLWILTMLLGIAGTLPLFLYLRENRRTLKTSDLNVK